MLIDSPPLPQKNLGFIFMLNVFRDKEGKLHVTIYSLEMH